jgi:hypothetical protein
VRRRQKRKQRAALQRLTRKVGYLENAMSGLTYRVGISSYAVSRLERGLAAPPRPPRT